MVIIVLMPILAAVLILQSFLDAGGWPEEENETLRKKVYTMSDGKEFNMEQSDVVSEGGEHLSSHGWRQPDLRNEQQCGAAEVEHRTHGGGVDSGFAAAGNTVKQKRC